VPEPLRLPRRRGRVLLVDDDAQVRATLAEQLQELGFRVLAVADGAAALAALLGGAEVALLVSDLTMPGMDGVALIRAAQRARPGLPAVLVTGHAGGGASLRAAGALDGPVVLLEKPVSAAQLADRIATLVERRAPGPDQEEV
jgi:CheY-like chemotaxis protein